MLKNPQEWPFTDELVHKLLLVEAALGQQQTWALSNCSNGLFILCIFL